MNYSFDSISMFVMSVVFHSRLVNSDWINFLAVLILVHRNIGFMINSYPVLVRCWSVISTSTLIYLTGFQLISKEIGFKIGVQIASDSTWNFHRGPTRLGVLWSTAVLFWVSNNDTIILKLCEVII